MHFPALALVYSLNFAMTLTGCGGATSKTTSQPPPSKPQASAADVLTYHNDLARTGQNLKETILNTTNVNSSTFGKLRSLAVDGKVDAQPLYLSNVTNIHGGTHNVVYVATEHGSVYAFDPDDGTQLWQISTLGSGETTSDNRGCGQVVPSQCGNARRHLLGRDVQIRIELFPTAACT